MSFRERAVPLMVATFIGITTGYYVFDPLLRQYQQDSRGTWDPTIAAASEAGGAGGGTVVSDPATPIARVAGADPAAQEKVAPADSLEKLRQHILEQRQKGQEKQS